MSSKPRLTPIELALIVDAIEGGQSFAGLANQWKLSRQTVRQAYIRERTRLDAEKAGQGSAANVQQ